MAALNNNENNLKIAHDVFIRPTESHNVSEIMAQEN